MMKYPSIIIRGVNTGRVVWCDEDGNKMRYDGGDPGDESDYAFRCQPEIYDKWNRLKEN